MLFVVLVRAGLWMGLTRARDLIIDSAPVLAWRRADPDAATGHAPRTIPARSFTATGSIPCSVGAPAFRSYFASLPRMSMMRPSPARCLNWPFVCSPCGLGWCA
jgi:hypothetical protein